MAIFENYVPVVVQALNARGLTGQCPMCKQNQWMLHDVPVSMPVYEATGAVTFPGTSMPMAAMICRNCGFAGFFTLGALGLINAPQSAAAPAPQSEIPPVAPAASAPPNRPPSQSSKLPWSSPSRAAARKRRKGKAPAQ